MLQLKDDSVPIHALLDSIHYDLHKVYEMIPDDKTEIETKKQDVWEDS